MIRIAGKVVSPEKHACIALQGIKGIGVETAKRICKQAKIPADKPLKILEDADVNRLTQIVQQETVEGDLTREVQLHIKRLKDINCYRGVRHRRRLPCRGQRTRTNARTLRMTKRPKVVKKATKQ